jgi:methionyl-tRNA formyltransferase
MTVPILFVGGSVVGDAVLRHLVTQGYPVTSVVGMLDHPHETIQIEPQMRALCERVGIHYGGAELPASALEGLIRDRGPRFLITTGYRRLIPPDVFRLCDRGAVGAHFSLLPAYRGFAPVNWAVLNGERTTGVSLFHLAEGMDSGDIVAQGPLEIGPDETAGEVLDRAIPLFLNLLDQHLSALLEGTAPRHPQVDDNATYTCARTPDDGRIDWSAPAEQIHNLVRALSHPFPGAFTTHGGRRLTVWRTRLPAIPRRYVGSVPGRIVGVRSGVTQVLAGDGVVELLSVQYPDEAETPAGRVLRSVRDTLGR